MTLFSAYEDFVNRSVGALEGTLGKLVFVAGLRSVKNEYEHWGLEYTHGAPAAKKAMSQAHSEVFQQVLETPIPQLFEEFLESQEKRVIPSADPERMIPKEKNGCSPEHFRYVLSALTLLAESRSSRRAA